jgi:N-acetylmuramoyl-L-alanine amidase
MVDSGADLIQIQLFKRLPYQSIQKINPTQIVLDIFGATNNTNWIDQPNVLKAIKEIQYEQVSDEHFRLIVSLKQKQHWGYKLYYEGNNLILRIRHQPEKLTLKGMKIALDAGHGGSNPGAVGALGIAEKSITLIMVKKLKEAFEKQGTEIILTRDKDTFFDNKQRILFYRDSMPDLLLSFHLNSSGNPFTGKGTSVFYRHEGFRLLGNCIYKRMLNMGLADYGNNGSFNFMLNSPTEYPNALIEALFLSNPEEEMLILDEAFQHKMANEIVEGVKTFLKECE